MKNPIALILSIIIILLVFIGGFLLLQLNNKINNTRLMVSEIETEISNLQTIIPVIAPSNTLSMVDLLTAVQPVIVRIDADYTGYKASGSGIIIRKDGYIITNDHVVDSASTITVTLNSGRQYKGRIINGDPLNDLALLKLINSYGDLPEAALGDIEDVVIGGIVVAGGFPLGSDIPGPASFTQGIVSAIRTLDNKKYIQTDVRINQCNSGGSGYLKVGFG
jgi:serine protease Do